MKFLVNCATRYGEIMRPTIILVLAVLIGALWVFDSYEYDGRYSAAAWEQTKGQAAKLEHEVEHWLGTSDH